MSRKQPTDADHDCCHQSDVPFLSVKNSQPHHTDANLTMYHVSVFLVCVRLEEGGTNLVSPLQTHVITLFNIDHDIISIARCSNRTSLLSISIARCSNRTSLLSRIQSSPIHPVHPVHPLIALEQSKQFRTYQDSAGT